MANKMIRTKSKVTGGITSAEKELMDDHAQLWIKRDLRTEPIEPDKIIPAIEGLYKAADLEKPRVVIVPSPLAMAFAYGASVAILNKPPEERPVRWGMEVSVRHALCNALHHAVDEVIRTGLRSQA